MNKRLRLRNQFYQTLTRDYSNGKKVVKHFYHKDIQVPIWAIFEVISLGEFGNFVSCTNINIKKDVSKSLKLNQTCDTDGMLTQSIIFLIKDLRNSIAHNDVIFDTRFRSGNPKKALLGCLQIDTSINNISFKTIVDYLILVIYLLKNLGVSKTEMHRMTNKFETLINHFRTQIPFNIYANIFHTDTSTKIRLLKTFISS